MTDTQNQTAPDVAARLAAVIREEVVRQYREDERNKCPAGSAFYESEISPYLIARCVLAEMGHATNDLQPPQAKHTSQENVSDNQTAAPTAREMGHLVGMCDGKRHCFFDHALARRMKDAGWIYNDGGNWRISEAGRAVAPMGDVSNGA